MASDFELPEAEVLAYQLAEAAADHFGEAAADEYLFAFVHEILMLEPGVRAHLAGLVLGGLCEEIAVREDPEHAFAAVELIRAIRAAWQNERG